MKKAKNIVFLVLITILFSKCVEPIELQSIEYDNLLVVEALLTNESKHHTVKLTRTFKLDSTGPKNETGASVLIKDNNQNTYSFTENSDGEYVSNQIFSAELGKSYTLEITTNDGTKYISTSEKTPKTNEIEDIEVVKEQNNLGKDGIAFYVNNNSGQENQYYRYEYEETYKIIAPYWNDKKILIVDYNYPFEFDVIKDTNNEQKQICYGTAKSTSIIQTQTESQSNGNLRFKVNFIEIDNAKFAHRYSILIKQYTQTIEAYNYYKTLSKLSTSQSLFTQNQPGQIASNISSSSNDNVLGIFEVASVSEKRIFINRQDIFPNTKTEYVTECYLSAPSIRTPIAVVDAIQSGVSVFHKVNPSPDKFYGPYWLVTTACGDCSKIADSNKPDFWID